MKIEIDVKDITLFACALNNAIAAYGDIIYGIYMCCDIPTRFEKLKDIPYDDLQERFKCLKDVYKQVEEIEKV